MAMGHATPDAAQTARAKDEILRLRREAYSAEYCAGQVGISRRTLYTWTEVDPEFAAAWREANESRLDWHEDVLRDCAKKGMFVPSLAILKSAGRIVDRSPPPGGTTINLYQVFQQILAPSPEQVSIEARPLQLEGELQPQLAPEHQAEPSQQLESAQAQLEDGTTQPAPRGKPSAKPASRRRPERQPLPR